MYNIDTRYCIKHTQYIKSILINLALLIRISLSYELLTLLQLLLFYFCYNLFFQVTHVSIVLVTKDFNPEKYEILCRILLKKYRKSGNPAKLLESYLSVLTRGSCSTEENGQFSVQDYDIKRSYANTNLKGFSYYDEMFYIIKIPILILLGEKRLFAIIKYPY